MIMRALLLLMIVTSDTLSLQLCITISYPLRACLIIKHVTSQKKNINFIFEVTIIFFQVTMF